ncbi:hypothetical protein ACWPKS_10450 [Coraliomargarita sp. W4R72]
MNSIEKLKEILPALNKSHIEKELDLKPRLLTYVQANRANITDCDSKKIFGYLGFTTGENVGNQCTSPPAITDSENVKLRIEIQLVKRSLGYDWNGTLFEFVDGFRYNPATGNGGTSKSDFCQYSQPELIEKVMELQRNQLAALEMKEEEEEEEEEEATGGYDERIGF